MTRFITRAYNNFEVDELRSTITKTSETERLADEIGYYQAISQTPLGVFFPRLVSNSVGTKNQLELEYYGYTDLGHSRSDDNWDLISGKINSILDLFEDHQSVVNGISDIKRSMYIDKTLKYQKELVSQFKYFYTLDQHNEVIINGKPLLNFNSVWPKTLRLIQNMLLDNSPLSIIHGDLCFSNILYEPEKEILRLVDPRGSFGPKGLFGDIRYDAAKLRHSYHGGYEFITQDKFDIDYCGNTINFKLEYPQALRDTITNAFEQHTRCLSDECKLIEGLIFIGMCSRHYDSLERQVVMYATGLEILNEVVL